MTLAYRIGVWAAIGVALASAAVVSYRHYVGLVDAKAELSARVAELRADVASETARADAYAHSIDRWAAAAATQAKALEDNTKVQHEAGKQARELKDVLSKHDLGKLATSRPGLIERRANDGTARAIRLLEQSTEGPAAAGAASSSRPGPAGP